MKPSISKILKNDYIALLSLIFPIVTWILFVLIISGLVGKVPLAKFQSIGNDPDAARIFLWIAIGASVIFVPVLTYRLASIFEFFQDAELAEGQIVNITRSRDRGRIDFAYIYQDQQFAGSHAVHFSKEVRQLEVGQSIPVAVSRENPAKALLAPIFAEQTE